VPVNVALVVLVALTTLGGRPARADDILSSLDYQTDPAVGACPDAGQFRAQIARQLGRDPFRDQAPHRLIARVALANGRLQGRVEWRDASDQWEGERTFSSRNDSCDQMVRAMALATAIQIQLLGLTRPEEAPPPTLDVVPPQPPPAPLPVAPIAIAPAPPKREPWVAVEAGVAMTQDTGGGPMLVAPRIAISVGRPSTIGLRLTASGFGPPADVDRAEGAAQVDRIRMTLEVVRFFRSGRRLQPFATLGGGWQELRVRGTSAMPTLGAAHDGNVFSGVAVAGGGLALSFASGLFVVVEAQAALYWPDVTVQIGSATSAAQFGGQGVLAHGGILARF